MRTPGNDYYPEEWDSEDYLLRDETIALNVSRIHKTTPYMISPQIAEFTRQFSEKVTQEDDGDLAKYNSEDWKNKYLDGKTMFVPENRWTHEVQRGPVHVKDNIYAIYLDADIFIRPRPKFYHDDKNEGSFGVFFEFITRTLYKYIKDTGNILYRDSYSNLFDEEYCLSIYCWVIRWLPYKNSKLTFYTTKEIEDSLGFKVDKFTIDCDETMSTIEVPVIFKTKLTEIVKYIMHDSVIMYMEVEENEKN